MQKIWPMNKILFTVIVLSLISWNLFSQKSDIKLISETDFHDHHFDKREVRYIFSGSDNYILKYNPVSLSFGGLLYFYQAVISAQFSTSCMYRPSCSEFSFVIIKEYGLIKGIPLTADRLMRCNKLGAVDVHPSKIDFKNGKVIEPVESFKFRNH